MVSSEFVLEQLHGQMVRCRHLPRRSLPFPSERARGIVIHAVQTGVRAGHQNHWKVPERVTGRVFGRVV